VWGGGGGGGAGGRGRGGRGWLGREEAGGEVGGLVESWGRKVGVGGEGGGGGGEGRGERGGGGGGGLKRLFGAVSANKWSQITVQASHFRDILAAHTTAEREVVAE